MMAYFDYTPTVTVLYLPFYLLLASIIGVSVGLWLAPCVVHFWDVQNITSFAVRAWMYATPIVYHISVIPEQWLFVYRLNPMVNIIEGYRWSLLGEGIAPDRFLALSMIPPILLLIAGAYVYRRAERNIVDIA
ncbi:MAG: ABC transporter permease [Verrucomicrobiota bacterium]